MAGHSKNYSRHIYLLDDEKTSYKGYKLKNTFLQNVDDLSDAIVLPVYIRIENNRGYNDSRGCDKWLRIKDNETWETSTLVTGLRSTAESEIFEGNFASLENGRYKPESLILVQFVKETETLVIDVFKGFYLRNAFKKRFLIINHEYYYNKKAAV